MPESKRLVRVTQGGHRLISYKVKLVSYHTLGACWGVKND